MSEHEAVGEDAQRVFETIVAEQLEHPDVTAGRMFHRDTLKINDKVFAMLLGGLAVKLPEERVTAEVDSGHGERLATRPDRPMREWLEASLRPGVEDHWHALAEEARLFVASSPASPPRSRKKPA